MKSTYLSYPWLLELVNCWDHQRVESCVTMLQEKSIAMPFCTCLHIACCPSLSICVSNIGDFHFGFEQLHDFFIGVLQLFSQLQNFLLKTLYIIVLLFLSLSIKVFVFFTNLNSFFLLLISYFLSLNEILTKLNFLLLLVKLFDTSLANLDLLFELTAFVSTLCNISFQLLPHVARSLNVQLQSIFITQQPPHLVFLSSQLI